MRVMVTGGAGFIGSHVVDHLVAEKHDVFVADRFTYAGKGRNLANNLMSLGLLIGDLASGDLAERIAATQPQWIVHMAAETHVDRAIEGPEAFIRSNVLGTTRLLQALRGSTVEKIIIYSTDEVFGSTPDGKCFDEDTPFNPTNAYSASKVGVEGIARAFYHTHGLPIVVVRPCNTYGPRQHPEKVIPKFIGQILSKKPVTIYNDGKGARDWLHVRDHARAVHTLLEVGSPGESYNLAAGDEHTDLDIYSRIKHELRQAEFIQWDPEHVYVLGRPGHDRRYWMDGSKLRALGWKPEVAFAHGLRDAVLWHAAYRDWWAHDVMYEADMPDSLQMNTCCQE